MDALIDTTDAEECRGIQERQNLCHNRTRQSEEIINVMALSLVLSGCSHVTKKFPMTALWQENNKKQIVDKISV